MKMGPIVQKRNVFKQQIGVIYLYRYTSFAESVKVIVGLFQNTNFIILFLSLPGTRVKPSVELGFKVSNL